MVCGQDTRCRGLDGKRGRVMISVFVGREATIIGGPAKGITGIVVMANSINKQVEIKLSEGTYISTNYDNIVQESEGE